MNNQLSLDFLNQLNTETIVITPNRRLSATLHKHYQQYQITYQHHYWQTPDILPASTWIQRLFDQITNQQFTNTPLLLSTTQEQFIWEQILLASKKSAELLQLSETAEMTRSAWNLLKQWRIDIEEQAFEASEDYSALLQWIKEFQLICAKKNWIDNASLPDYVANALISQSPRTCYGAQIPQKIILFGFTELSPQLKYFLSQFETMGCKIEMEALQLNSQCALINFPDQKDEILTLARFAKSTLAKHPLAQIGCVIPSLEKIRDRVQQIFSEVFAEENTYTINPAVSPFNISAGKNLLQYPVIHAALQLLALHKKNVPIETFSYILSSPFLAGAETERIRRAHADGNIRRINMNNIDLITATQAETSNTQFSLTTQCPELTKRIKLFLDALLSLPEKCGYDEWANTLNRLLSILGWPGERVLNSEEYQVVETWLQLLNDFSTLDQITETVTLQTALYTLHKMAKKQIFQPKTPAAPIQVLGILEAAALPFDYLWITGMDDLSWPPQPRPHPLIPKSLQRELNMPHATAERELTFCKTITQQFKDSAQHIFFSYATKNDNLELQPSPLIRDLTTISLEQLELDNYLSPAERIYHSKKIDVLADEKAPTLTTTDKVTGGISIIKLQALCPFRAFAECRLYARELESPLPGLRPKDRGNIMHKALELIWNEIGNHATLVNSDENYLHELINRHIEYAITTVPHSRSHYKQYITLEKQRLFKIIKEWLQLEKEREPFKISRNETKEQIKLNQLQLSIRIDRIDELENGKKFIIDYKTGKNNEINSWFSERPEEPQLPLYALIDKENTAGIAFAQITPGESCFKGVSHNALTIKGIKLVNEIKKTTALSWAEQLDQWNIILGKLSDDFYSGDARVDPKDPTQTCTWCAMKPLCRINEELHDS